MRIIYLDIDSIRPDHMSCYGYPRKTTPNIDKIAERGARFNQCYCASSPCVPSRASFMSGRFGINHGAMTHWGPGSAFRYPEGEAHSEKVPFFPRYLRRAEMKTVTFSSFGDRHHAWWYFAGWSEVHTHTLKEGNEDGHEVNEAVIPWLKQHGREDNYFLHIQYWDPHVLYTYPREYAQRWATEPLKEFPAEDIIQQHQRDKFPNSAVFLHMDEEFPDTMPGQVKNREDLKHLIDGYDGGIHYMDKCVGEVMDTLREMGIEDEVCWVISADHGESLGEHGIYMEHASATDEVHHIPLIMSIPGVTDPGKAYDGLIYNVDVIATLADLAGLETPDGWDGYSFLPKLRGEAYRDREYLVMDHGLYMCQRAVRDNKWHFIRTFHPGLYAFEPVVLYDMDNDPHQLVNVAERNPEVVKEMDHRLAAWTHDQLGKHGHPGDPMQQVIQTGPWKYVTLEQWVDRLRNAGEDETAEKLLQKYSRTH